MTTSIYYMTTGKVITLFGEPTEITAMRLEREEGGHCYKIESYLNIYGYGSNPTIYRD